MAPRKMKQDRGRRECGTGVSLLIEERAEAA